MASSLSTGFMAIILSDNNTLLNGKQAVVRQFIYGGFNQRIQFFIVNGNAMLSDPIQQR